jgi:hypothetical protein
VQKNAAIKSGCERNGSGAVAGKGKAVNFHGAFKTEAGAMAKERARKDAFILARKVRGKKRFFVLTPR